MWYACMYTLLKPSNEYYYQYYFMYNITSVTGCKNMAYNCTTFLYTHHTSENSILYNVACVQPHNRILIPNPFVLRPSHKPPRSAQLASSLLRERLGTSLPISPFLKSVGGYIMIYSCMPVLPLCCMHVCGQH